MKKTNVAKKAMPIRAFVITLLAVVALLVGGISLANAGVGDTPPHTKGLTDNHDGTYTISLDVVGDSEKKPNNINVIVIFDTSGSMNSQRMSAAKNAVNSLARALFAYNTTSSPDTVEMALVRFATSSSVAQQPTSSQTTFTSAVNGLGNQGNGGTNWESALQTANGVNFGDNDQTFVIFVSDGNPTFRTTQNGWNDWNNQYQQWGSGQETTQNIQRCYTTAVDDAQALATRVTPANFFTIGAFGNVDRMEQLTNDAGSSSSTNYYSASDTAALNQAISDILAKIEMTGIANAEIDDGTTNQVTTSSGEVAELLEVDTSSFKYYRSGGTYGTMQPWADAPAATFENGEVEWDLSSVGVLENGVRYTVTFDCYPSQYTYDLIARLKNGDIKYSDLDPEIRKYIKDNGDGTYTLLTNTGASLSWDDTRDEAGQQTSAYTNPDPVNTDSSTLIVSKEWEGGNPDVDSIDMTVLMDGRPFHETTLSPANGWSSSSFISPGIIKNGKVLPGAEGHDFTFAELDGSQYHWELDSPTVHPMLINGTLTMLVKVDATHPAPSGATTYDIKGATYYVDSSAGGLTATNHRRSNLNLTKVVTGEDAPADARFPFALTVENSKAPTTAPSAEDDPNHESDYWVWLSVRDENGQGVTGLNMGTGVVEDSDGYYYAPSGTTFNLEIGAGWSLRFLNLPTGSTYRFVEGTLPEGFTFNKSELTQGTDTTFSGAQTTTGTIQNTKTSYTVQYTNDYQLTNLTITKRWEDNDNQDGIRPTAAEFAELLTLSPAVQGATPTVKDNEDGTYTITYTDLPRFVDGKEVTYTVAEAAIVGYDTTGSPANDHGTITNTHTPETIESISATKVWDDAENQDGIRPESVTLTLTGTVTDAEGTTTSVYGPASVVLDGTVDEEGEGVAWTASWGNLPKYSGGIEVAYTVEETKTDVITGIDGPGTYAISVTGSVDGGFTVTNTHTPETIESISATKVWDDDNNRCGIRPDSVTLTLIGKVGDDTVSTTSIVLDGTADESGESKAWVATWSKLPKYYGGAEITYTVTEEKIDYYATEITGSAAEGFTVTNTFKPDPATATIQATKVLTGRPKPLEAREFSFTITAAEGTPMPAETTVTNDAEGKVSFGSISYNTPGTYTYTITEVKGDVGGVTYDEHRLTATVTVKINEKGELVAEVSYEGNQTFTNTYGASPTTAQFGGSKVLDGRALNAEEFTFELVENGEVIQTATNDAEGKFSFQAIEYTEPGTHTYTIREAQGSLGGITYDKSMYAVTVVVSDNGQGQLVATTTGADSIVFSNTYKTEPATASIKAKKILEGRDLNVGEFSFTITAAAEGTPMPKDADGNEVTTVTNLADGTIDFGTVSYDKPGTYTYTISEVKGSLGGVTYDTSTITVTVTVTDDGQGQLVAEVAYSPEGATFTNTYTPDPASVTISGNKVLQGRALNEGEFSFTLSAVTEGAPMPAKEGGETATNAADGTFSFAEIVYTEPGTYVYTVSEDTSALPGGVQGVTTNFNVTVTVTDNLSGKLEATVAYPESGNTLVNTYGAKDATLVITGTKLVPVPEGLLGPESIEGKFTFTLSGSEGAPMPESTTATNDASGAVQFGTITFTRDCLYNEETESYDVTREFTYAVTESGSLPGVTNEGVTKTITVTVTDNLDGTLTATASKDDTGSSFTFTNPYSADDTSATFSVEKVLEGRDLNEGEFTFELLDSDGEVIQTTTNDAEGHVTFDSISYDTPGAHTYTIREVNDGLGGVTYDEHTVTVTVNVTDNREGKLVAKVSYDGDTTFTNTYEAAPTTYQFGIVKSLKGAEMTEGQFSFELLDADGNVLETVTNKADGSVNFSAITYEEPGTYTYTVREVNGGEVIDGITYDDTEITITVTVEDNLKGSLVVSDATFTPDSATIVNTYEPTPASATITARKTLKGATLADGQFTFELTDADGNVVATATNDADGNITFDPISYTEAGTYTYRLSEVAGSDSHITYDRSFYTVTVTVTDDGKGNLSVEVTGDGASATFNNVYTKQEKEPDPEVPKTGDPTNNLPAAALGLLGGTAIVAGAVLRRRRED